MRARKACGRSRRRTPETRGLGLKPEPCLCEERKGSAPRSGVRVLRTVLCLELILCRIPRQTAPDLAARVSRSRRSCRQGCGGAGAWKGSATTLGQHSRMIRRTGHVFWPERRTGQERYWQPISGQDREAQRVVPARRMAVDQLFGKRPLRRQVAIDVQIAPRHDRGRKAQVEPGANPPR